MENTTTTKRRPVTPPGFTDGPYFRSYARRPAGHGYWFFQASATREARDADLYGEPVAFTGTYAEAKAEALAHFTGPAFSGGRVTWVAVLP